MVFWALSPPRDLPYFRSTATTAMPSFFSSPWRDFIWSEVSSAGAADDGENASNTPPPSVASASFSSFSCSSVRCDSVQTCSAMSPSDMTALCGMVHDRGGSCSVGARPRRGTRRGRAPTLQTHTVTLSSRSREPCRGDVHQGEVGYELPSLFRPELTLVLRRDGMGLETAWPRGRPVSRISFDHRASGSRGG